MRLSILLLFIVLFLQKGVSQTGNDLYMDNARYLYAKTSSGTNTRMLGINASNNLYLGSVDASVNNMYVNLNGQTRLSVNGSNGNVGIGTTVTSNGILTINGDSYSGLRIENDVPLKEASIRFRSKNVLGTFFQSDISSFYDGNVGFIGIKAPHNNTPGVGYDFVVNSLGNVGIGTTSLDSKLAVNGNIHAKEVKVDLMGWPDYVFNENYDLPSLKEVEKHINEKGHLINIPSAKEVEANGIELGEMNKLLLEKIEELTLYVLEQEKKLKNMKVLEEQVGELKLAMEGVLKKQNISN
ncbi:hypothetical protein HZY62_21695 [Maribacter polysiphoniae]|uniref:Uncharacterized protein n=1 Tax=Maribacter polysiphoniae TaxID=429344 RepID=A0A316DJ21_9FLAO|nr:hypothetical protein [Maribacter polysiphoniae]MBD1263215.1 hypothetical protein [Maribacter polysiphoniae]PWK17492.1 hypothetical protein LX92_04439 [Maribacter polysiphoniae]